jgi:2,3-bisphosphoglycerate-independent phosphoglycerate mutase
MKKVLTIILDGFGIRNDSHGNAIKMANMPNFNKLWNEYPHSLLKASERAVGLEKGQMGNSEVGHETIGAGRLIKQNVMQIDDFFKNDELKDNPAYNDLLNYVKDNDRPIHLMALCSDGGIHSELRFILKLIGRLHQDQINNVYVHAITDGRDTKTNVSYNYLKQISDLLNEYHMGKIVSVCGRYYAMDRDQKWERTKLYSDLVTEGKGFNTNNLEKFINECYQKKITDEFLPPIMLDVSKTIKDGDVLVWFNYRPDRAKQILRVLTDINFNNYQTIKLPNLKTYTIYDIPEAKNSKHFLNHIDVVNPLGVYLASLGLNQARIAETEKYAHVTYFFDGGKDLKLPGCDRFLIPSPKVATYDLKPEMSSIEVTKEVLKCLEKDYDFILLNFASPDMVGHTGNLAATIKALEVIDVCLGKIYTAALDNFFTIFILGDHGNCDLMLDENNVPVTTHSLSPVPFVVTDNKIKLIDGALTSVAPTILDYMDIAIPKEMQESNSLIYKEEN